MAFLASLGVARADEALVFSPASGDAPLQVTIAGPPRVVDKLAKCEIRRAWFGKGLEFDWGDGSGRRPTAPPAAAKGSCVSSDGTHTYAVPGTYAVTVKDSHAGPTDARVIDWTGKASITVGGPGKPDRLDLVAVDTTQAHYGGYVRVRWRSDLKSKAAIRLEALLPSGVSLVRLLDKPWSIEEEGEDRIFLQSKPYEEALRRGEKSFRVRLSLVREGEVVLAQTSGDLPLSARYPDALARLSLKETTGKGPYLAAFQLKMINVDCASYLIAWGDGEETRRILPADGACHADESAKEVSHAYSKAGKYSITLRDNGGDRRKDVLNVIPYFTLDIDIAP